MSELVRVKVLCFECRQRKAVIKMPPEALDENGQPLRDPRKKCSSCKKKERNGEPAMADMRGSKFNVEAGRRAAQKGVRRLSREEIRRIENEIAPPRKKPACGYVD